MDVNERSTVDFNQDFAMMNLLISEFTTNDDGSMYNTFGLLLDLQKEYIPNGWKSLDEDQKVKIPAIAPNRAVTRDTDVKNHGAHLLLLLAYIMLSNVLDDKSNDVQM